MISDDARIKSYALRAEEFGLVLRGGLNPVAEDAVPPVTDGVSPQTLMLFGNAGSSIWKAFSSSTEYRDGEPDPLNRWSERIGNMLADEWGGKALFPFGGPPYQPFLRWAKKAEKLESSQLGMLMHPVYGLWHAYRFAVALPDILDMDASSHAEAHACDSCVDKPCLKGCPVNAFDGSRYDLETCYRHLESDPESACHRFGCQARVACPEGINYVYEPDHAAFHMEKFVLSQAAVFGDSAQKPK
ncbi:MAG: ferredoxin [Gammaproteobacteria bacterium]